MKKLLHSHNPIKHIKSFKYASQGIWHALANEANFRVEVALTIVSIGAGIHFGLTAMEWGLLILALGFLLTAEIINTVIEEFIDHLIKEHHEGARIIKDLSAGFVLVAALTTLAILCLLFWSRVYVLM